MKRKKEKNDNLKNIIMGRYMTVVLKQEYTNDLFIKDLNRQLGEQFGATDLIKFNPFYFLDEEADYFNNDLRGKKEIPNIKRPITGEFLHENFFWYGNGEFSIKLSGGPTLEEAQDAVAICKWIIHTKAKYIDKKQSSEYSRKIISQYLNYVFEDAGHNLKKVWEMPKHKISA